MKELIKLFNEYADRVIGQDLVLSIYSGSSEDSTGYVENEDGSIFLSFKDLNDLKYQLENELRNGQE